MIDADAERPGDAVGGDVVMGRPDATCGKDVIIAPSQRVQGCDDVGLLVGDDAHLLEVDPDIGEVFRDKADVLVFGSSGQDLVPDHQNAGRNDIAHDLSSSSRACSAKIPENARPYPRSGSPLKPPGLAVEM